MDCEKIEKIFSIQNRFIGAVEVECGKRGRELKEGLENCLTIEIAEKLVLENVKFIGSILEEIRRSNKIMAEEIGMSYAKFVGLGTPYEEAIFALRKVKTELDIYLKILRDKMVEDLVTIRNEVINKRSDR